MRSTQPGSLQSFSYVCRVFRFCGDEPVSFRTLPCDCEPDTLEKGNEDDQGDFASFPSEFDTWEVESNSSFVSCESQFLDFDFFSEGPDEDPEGFSEVFGRSETDFCFFTCVLEEPGRVSGRFGGVRAGSDVPWVTENR